MIFKDGFYFRFGMKITYMSCIVYLKNTQLTKKMYYMYNYSILYCVYDTKWVIRMCKSKNRQHNSQKKKDKRTDNDLQNIHIKLKID